MKPLYIFSSIVILIISLCFYHFYVPLSLDKEAAKVITIKKGSYPSSIASQLEKSDLIRSAFFFKLYVKWAGVGSKLKAGSFLLQPHMSLSKIVEALITENGNAALVRVTIPEGFSINDIAHRLDALGIISAKTFSTYAHTQAINDMKPKYPFLQDVDVATIEGYLFPDTYFFSKNVTAKRIVDTMLNEFSNRLMPLWDEDDAEEGTPKQRFSLHQVLTLASFIEKEARVQSEMPLISSVFCNRLRKKMPLASDPTVVYALGERYKDRVYYKDLKIDSPYNTYKYSGFTPSPIASVGEAAFKAALRPVESNYLFFVANSNGTHYFSATYEEHLAYQRKGKHK